MTATDFPPSQPTGLPAAGTTPSPSGPSRAAKLQSAASGRLSQASTKAKQSASSNPLGISLSGIGLGLLAGMLAPVANKEAQAVAPAASKVRSALTAVTTQVKSVAQDAFDQGKRLESESKA